MMRVHVCTAACTALMSLLAAAAGGWRRRRRQQCRHQCWTRVGCSGTELSLLSHVMFMLSDAMIAEEGFAELAKLTTMLLDYGADPAPTLELAEQRYGKYSDGLNGYPVEDDNVWVPYRLVTEASELHRDAIVDEMIVKWAARLQLPPRCRSVRALVQSRADPAEAKLPRTQGVAVCLVADQQVCHAM